jgi:hypothetical protein
MITLTLYTIPYTLQPIHYTLYNLHYTLYTIHYTLHPTPYTLYPNPNIITPTPPEDTEEAWAERKGRLEDLMRRLEFLPTELTKYIHFDNVSYNICV